MSENGDTKWERLNEVVSQTMKAMKVPGVALGILHQGRLLTAGFGVTNNDHPLPVTDETLFQIGSITKTYTGTALMRLVEAGKVELDAPVRTYLPDFKVADENASANATVRHLMTHVSGWVGDFFHDTGSGQDAVARYVADMASLEQLAPLGEIWSYNNSGFAVAGRIIETVTGQEYEAALRELVLEPLGLEHSFFDPGDVMTHRFVVGHSVAGDEASVARPWPMQRAIYAVGGLTCHVKDLLAYARFHLGDGTAASGDRLLEPETLAQMHTPQVTVWEQESWGLTWSVDDTYGTRFVSHGGGTTGQVTQLLLAPEFDFAIAILTNADRGGLLIEEVVRHAAKAYLEVDVPAPETIESAVEDLTPYVGVYSRPFMDMELGILGGRLVGQVIIKGSFPTEDAPVPPPPPPVSLGRCEKDRLLVLDGRFKDTKVDVLRRPDGSIGWLRMGRIHARQDG